MMAKGDFIINLAVRGGLFAAVITYALWAA